MYRKNISITLLMVAALVIFGGASSFADDTEIYSNSGGGVEPNVLVIFDNSASMNNEISSSIYDPAFPYPGVYNPTPVYHRFRGTWDNVFRDSVAAIVCPEARNALAVEGFYNGTITMNSQCGGKVTRYLRTGNYLNFLATVGSSKLPRLGVAKGTIQSFVNTTWGVRFGAMIFNPEEGGHLLREVRDMTAVNRADLHNAIGGLIADTWTPLAETLYEAGLYFQGAASYFNAGVSYTSPITDWCQKNYVIIITDGEPTRDKNAILTSLGSNGDVDGDAADPGTYDEDGSDYLDDVAKYLYDTDLSPLDEKQNLVTYTIGFTVAAQLLEDTAENGRGKYYHAHNAQSFAIVFQKIIMEILEESTSFTAPVVPISQMEKTTSGSRMYLALFKPTENAFWKGNIKKFSLATAASGDIEKGDVLDVYGNAATDDEGHILDTAVSFWGSSDPDGGDTEFGGVGEVLLNRTTARNIYTWLDVAERPLNHPNNGFSKNNPRLTSAMLLAVDDIERNKIIDFVYGYDAHDEDGDLNFAERRNWILGAFLHSRPVVVHYDSSTSVIFAGANDGMVHAFLDSDGSELWGFIPPHLLEKLKNMNGATLEYFIDGAPKVAVFDTDMDGIIEPAAPDYDQVILVFGLRRGGSDYYALDVTDPYTPMYLWHISPDQADFSEMGQSWSDPVVGKVRVGTDDRMVVFFGGGYDINQDNDPVVGADTAGRGVYVADLFDGTLLWKSTYDAATNPSMAYCIPSAITALDTNDDPGHLIDRLYVGDTGGQMWRFDIGDPDPLNWTAKVVFDDSGSGRKIFYPPDVVFEKDHEMLFWGTGDRANPKNTSVINRIYAVKDRDPAAPLIASDLVDVTSNLVQDGTDQERAATLAALYAYDGWYVELNENAGEKVLASTIVYFGVAYLTTFTPTAVDPNDPCYVGLGTGRLYALDYMNAAAVLNFDETSDDLEKSDRSMIIGTAIPSGMVIALIHGMGSSYIGVGGGIFTSEVVHAAGITRIFWRCFF